MPCGRKVSRPTLTPYPLLLWFPLASSPNPAPTRPEGLQGQLCGGKVDVAQSVGAAEELLEGRWGLPALPAETSGVSKGGGHPPLAPSLPAPPTLPPVRAAVARQVEVGQVGAAAMEQGTQKLWGEARWVSQGLGAVLRGVGKGSFLLIKVLALTLCGQSV